jgi:hypothetical protein
LKDLEDELAISDEFNHMNPPNPDSSFPSIFNPHAAIPSLPLFQIIQPINHKPHRTPHILTAVVHKSRQLIKANFKQILQRSSLKIFADDLTQCSRKK